MNVLRQPSNNYQKAWLVAVLEQEKLTPATKVVATFLREVWWYELGTPDEPTNKTLHASYEQIQRATHLSNDTIARAIQQLEDEGFLHQTIRSKKQGVANRYYPVRYDLAIQGIVDDYLNLDLSGFAFDLSETALDLSEDQSVNSYEVVVSSNTEDIKEDEVVVPLDALEENSLDETPARVGHKEELTFTQKAHKRQADINAGILAEFGVGA